MGAYEYGFCLHAFGERHRDAQEDEIRSEQVSLILGKQYLILFQEQEGDMFDPIRERIRKGKEERDLYYTEDF